jgi:preprotein translocase subunit YajC
MNWLISPAQAAEAGAQAQPDWWGWVWLAFLIVFFYFFLIRPQRKREKAQAALMAALNKGDEVVTQAGLVGVIAKVEDDFVQVKVGPTTLRFQKAAVIGILPKGTLKQLDAEGG